MSARTKRDAAEGALLGACVGDAAGATLEFIGHAPSQEEVERAMSMPGGGVWRVAQGQITDDGELTLCLARALAESEENDGFDLERIASNYADWIRSSPFDVGITTRQSLGCFTESHWDEVCKTEGYAVAMTQAARQHCTASKANGSLMRASPLGVWGHRLSDARLAEHATRDSSLSHPNPTCCHAVACYTIAIAHLVENLDDREGAFARAQDWAEESAVAEVRDWLREAKEGVDVPFQPQDGFARIAFTHAFRHLLAGSSYVEAISAVLSGGGDTDTNACIVGGLVGAACGTESIPEAMRRAVLTCDTERGRWRPEFLRAGQIPEFVDGLLSKEVRKKG
jgi:ADP-ribosyl-[dinitrogen reductase] hydrolase